MTILGVLSAAAVGIASNLNPLNYYYYTPCEANKFIVKQEELELAIKNLRKVKLPIKLEIEQEIEANNFQEKKNFFEKVSTIDISEAVAKFNYIQ